MVLTSFTSYSGGISSDIGDDKNVFVWNACPGEYKTNGSGTFNINVPNGLSGIFIQKKSLDECIDMKIQDVIGSIDSELDDILDF